METNRVLLIEDHPIVAKSICDEVNHVFCQEVYIEIVTTIHDAIGALNQSTFRLVIADLTLDTAKVFKHIELCKKTKTPCIVFTASTQYSIIKECIDRGASAFVMKSSKISELQNAIKCILHFDELPYLCAQTRKAFNVPEIDGSNHEIKKPILSVTEAAILKLIIEGKRMNEIASILSNRPNTIKKHRHNIIKNNNCTIDNVIKRYLFWNGVE